MEANEKNAIHIAQKIRDSDLPSYSDEKELAKAYLDDHQDGMVMVPRTVNGNAVYVGYITTDSSGNIGESLTFPVTNFDEETVMVPVDPTEEMIEAINWQLGPNCEGKTAGTTRAIYKAMITATKDTQ